MNSLALMLGGGLAAAGLVAYVAHRVGDAKRRRSPFLRSIPEALERAKRGRRRVVVAFVQPKDAASDELLELLVDQEVESVIRKSFEIVQIDAPDEDRQVVDHLAAKYGLAKLSLPSLLALDAEGKKVGALEGELGKDAQKRIISFAEMSRPGG